MATPEFFKGRSWSVEKDLLSHHMSSGKPGDSVTAEEIRAIVKEHETSPISDDALIRLASACSMRALNASNILWKKVRGEMTWECLRPEAVAEQVGSQVRRTHKSASKAIKYGGAVDLQKLPADQQSAVRANLQVAAFMRSASSAHTVKAVSAAKDPGDDAARKALALAEVFKRISTKK